MAVKSELVRSEIWTLALVPIWAEVDSVLLGNTPTTQGRQTLLPFSIVSDPGFVY